MGHRRGAARRPRPQATRRADWAALETRLVAQARARGCTTVPAALDCSEAQRRGLQPNHRAVAGMARLREVVREQRAAQRRERGGARALARRGVVPAEAAGRREHRRGWRLRDATARPAQARGDASPAALERAARFFLAHLAYDLGEVGLAAEAAADLRGAYSCTGLWRRSSRGRARGRTPCAARDSR